MSIKGVRIDAKSRLSSFLSSCWETKLILGHSDFGGGFIHRETLATRHDGLGESEANAQLFPGLASHGGYSLQGHAYAIFRSYWELQPPKAHKTLLNKLPRCLMHNQCTFARAARQWRRY